MPVLTPSRKRRGDPFAGLLVEGFLASQTLYPSTTSAMSDFHERFDIEIDMWEARKRFVVRVYNYIFDIWENQNNEKPSLNREVIFRSIASELGKRYYENQESIYDYINDNEYKDDEDYWEFLHVIELIYIGSNDETRLYIDKFLKENILFRSELDLGIRWQDGKFIRTGAKLLDDKLVNDPLKWLKDKGYSTVTTPFQNALSHFLKSEFHPEGLPSVITEAYKSLEALAKIVLKNRKHLRNNQEQFISNIKATKFHGKMLRDYIDYGCVYRHAEDTEEPLPGPSKSDVEFFLYYTGMFLRLAMENWEGS